MKLTYYPRLYLDIGKLSWYFVGEVPKCPASIEKHQCRKFVSLISSSTNENIFIEY
jgi:hypothetical protein